MKEVFKNDWTMKNTDCEPKKKCYIDIRRLKLPQEDINTDSLMREHGITLQCFSQRLHERIKSNYTCIG